MLNNNSYTQIGPKNITGVTNISFIKFIFIET